MTPEREPRSPSAALAAVVRRRRVRYRVSPAYDFVGEERTPIGFDVELFGAHPPHAHALPGCSLCRELWAELSQLGRVLARALEGRASVTEVEPYEPVLAAAKERDGTDRDEVRLTLAVRHRAEALAPIDACERLCQDDLVQMLRALGAKPVPGRER